MRMVPITTERFTLEPLTVDHAEEMTSVLAPAELYTFTGGEPPTLEGLKQRYRSQIAGPDTADEIWMNWIIRRLADGHAVGFLQADIIGDDAELAWVVAPDCQGNGVAPEGAAAVKDWLASEGVRTFSAHIHHAHSASQTVAAKIGLVDTGQVDDDGEQIWSTSGV